MEHPGAEYPDMQGSANVKFHLQLTEISVLFSVWGG